MTDNYAIHNHFSASGIKSVRSSKLEPTTLPHTLLYGQLVLCNVSQLPFVLASLPQALTPFVLYSLQKEDTVVKGSVMLR